MDILLNEKQVLNKNIIAILGVDYNEFNTKSYSGITIDINDEKSIINTGNFDLDYLSATQWVKGIVDRVYDSSSIDNFIADRENNL